MSSVPNGFSPVVSLNASASIADDDTQFAGGSLSFTSAEVEGQSFFIVGGDGDEDGGPNEPAGLGVFSIGSDGTLTNVFNVDDDDTLVLNNPYSLDTAVVDGTTFLFASSSEDGVQVFSIASDGSLSSTGSVVDGGDLNIRIPLSLTTATVDGTVYLFVPGYRDDGVSVFSVDAAGTLTNVANVTDSASVSLDGPYHSKTALIGGNTYLFVGGYSDHGMTVYAVEDDGSLTSVDVAANSASSPLYRPNSWDLAEVDGKTYLFVTQSGSAFGDDSGISVFQVDENGQLTFVESVSDTADTAFDGVKAITTASFDGTTYVFVTGSIDNGVSAFAVGAGGSLIHLDALFDSSALLLNWAGQVAAYEANGLLHLAITSSEDGFQILSMDPFVVGLVDGSDTGSLRDDVTSDQTPTIAYKIDNDFFVRIDWDDGRGFVDVADGTGELQEATLDVAYTTDGVKTITVEATDFFDVATTYEFSLTIDTSAPAAPTLGLSEATDSGPYDDGLTNKTSQELEGSAEGGSTVEVLLGTTSLGTAQAAIGSGAWSLDIALAEGTHDLTAVATNMARVVGTASDVFSLTVDETPPAPPTIGLHPDTDSVTDGDGFTSFGSQTLTGIAEVGTMRVYVYNGDVFLDSTDADADTGSWSLDVTLANGAHDLSVNARDWAWNLGEKSDPFALIVSTTPPEAPTLDLSAGSDSGTVGDGFTTAATQMLTGVAGLKENIEVFSGSTSVGTTTSDANTGAWSLNVTLSDNTHSLTAIATDLDGRSSEASDAYALTVDTTGPDITSIALASASDTGTLGDNITSETNPTIEGTTEAEADVEVFWGSTSLGTTAADASGDWSLRIDLSEHSDTYSNSGRVLTAVATDEHGNVGPTSKTLIVRVDTVAPDAPTLGLAAASDSFNVGDGLSNYTSQTLEGTATAGATVEVFNDGTSLGTTPADATTGAWSLGTTLSEGAYSLIASVFDAAGNSGNSAAFDLTIDTTAPEVPTLFFSADTDSGIVGDWITNSASQTFYGDAEAGAFLQNWIDGVNYTWTRDTDSSEWTGTVHLDEGSFEVWARVMDAAGNIGTATDTYTLVVDRTPLTTPTLGLDATSDSATLGDGITDETSQTLTGTADAGATVEILEGTTSLGTVVADASTGVWSLDTTFAEGEYDLTATVEDDAGNTATSDVFALVVDTTAPGAPTVELDASSDFGVAGDGITSAETQTISGTAEAGATINLYSSSSNYLGSTTVSDSGSWSLDIALSEGEHWLDARITDAAGNSRLNNNLSLTVDTTVPDYLADFSEASAVGALVDDGGSIRLGGVTDLATAVITGQTYLFAVSLYDSTVSSYLIGEGGSLTHVDNVVGGDDLALDRVNSIEAVQSGGITYLYTSSGLIDHGVTAFEVSDDGSLTHIDTVFDSDDNALLGASDLTAVQFYSDFWLLFAAGSEDDGVTGFDLSSGPGVLNAEDALFDDDVLRLESASFIDSGHIDGKSFVFVAGDIWGEGLSVFGVLQSGERLFHVDNFGDDPDLDDFYIFAIKAVEVGDSLFLYVSDSSEDPFGVRAFSVSTDGILTSIDAVDVGSAADLAAPSAMSSFELRGTTYLVANNASGDEFSIFSIATDGSLTSVANVQDGSGTPLDYVQSTTTAVIDGETYLFAAAFGDSTISVMRLETAPAINLIDSSDSRTLGDDITSDTTPTVEFAFEADAQIRIDWDDGNGFVALVDATGSAQQTTLGTAYASDGNKTITVEATDVAGNAVEHELIVTIDSTAPDAPTLSLMPATDSGTLGDGVTNAVPLTMTGSTDPFATVELSDGTNSLGTADADDAGIWSLDVTLADGDYTFTATSTDLAGNIGDPSSQVAVTVDTVAPSAAIDFSTGTDSGTLGDLITNAAAQTIAGTTEAGSRVEILVDNISEGSVTADASSGEWALDVTLQEGSYQITAIVTDIAGNVSTLTHDATIDVTVPDPTTVGLTTDTDGGTEGDGLTGFTPQVLTGTSEAGATIDVFEGSSSIGTATADATTGEWSLETTLVEGSYSLTATVTDVAGNTGASSEVFALTVDTTLPDVPTLSLSEASDSGTVGDGATNISSVRFEGTAETGSTVEVLDASYPLGTAIADSEGEWSLDIDLVDGEYSLTATATDDAGNTSIATDILTLNVDATAPDAPTLGFDAATDSGLAGDGITNATSQTMAGTAEAGSTVELLLQDIQFDAATADENGEWSLETTLSEGTATFTVTATDVAGNTSDPEDITLIVDTTGPAAPTLGLDALTDSDEIGDGATRATDQRLSGTTDAGASIEVFEGSTSLGIVTADEDGNWELEVALTPDEYSITAVATDVAGNLGATTDVFELKVEENLSGDLDVKSGLYVTHTLDFLTENASIIGETAGDLSGAADATFSFSVGDRLDLFDGTYTKTGVDFRGSASGEFGFGVEYGLEGFDVDAAVQTSATADFPDQFRVVSGETVYINGGEDRLDASFETSVLDFNLAVSVIAQLDFYARVYAGIVGKTGSSTTRESFDERFELFRADSDGLTLIDQFTLPDPDGDVAFRLEIEHVLGNLAYGPGTPIVVKENGVVLLGPDPAVTVDLGSLGVDLSGPAISDSGTESELSGSQSDKVAELDFSLTGIAAMYGFPPLQVDANLSVFGRIEMVLAEANLGPTIDLVRDLAFRPELGVTIDFSEAVLIDGSEVTSWTGAWSEVPGFVLTEEITEITPTFSQIGTFSTDLDLTVGIEADFEALEIRYVGGGLDEGLGPVLDESYRLPELVSFDAFDSTFQLPGFNTSQGAAVTLVMEDSFYNPGIADGIEDAPEATDDAFSVFENAVLDLTDRDLFANDFDPDPGDTFSVAVYALTDTLGSLSETNFEVGATDGYSAEVAGSLGTFAYDPAGAFSYLNDSESATDTFGYTITDSTGREDTGVVTVTVNGVTNQRPVITSGDLARSLYEGYSWSPWNEDLSGTITWEDEDPYDTHTIALGDVELTLRDGDDVELSLTDYGFTASDIAQLGDLLSIDNDGNWLFEFPDELGFEHGLPGDWTLEIASEITVSDTVEASEAIDFTYTLVGKGDLPIVTGELTGDVTEGDIGDTATVTGTMAIDDVDFDNSPSFEDVASTISNKGFGTFTLVAGAWTFTLDQAAAQSLSAGATVSDRTTFTATDGTRQAVIVTITGSDDPTTLTDITLSGDEDEQLNSTALISDVDDEDLTFSLWSEPSNGTATVSADGEISYTPDAHFHGTDSFEYSVIDGSGVAISASVSITLASVNDAPVPVDDSLISEEDRVLAGNLLATDPDGDDLVFLLQTQPQNGLVTLGENGAFEYDPNKDFFGADRFEFKVDDGNGRTAIGTIDIAVEEVPEEIVMSPGDSEETASATLEQLDGGELTGFDEGDRVLIEDGDELSNDNFFVDEVTGEVTIGDTTFTVDADLQLNSFVLVEGESGGTELVLVNELLGDGEDLGEGITVDVSEVNGIELPAFRVGNGTRDFTITFDQSVGDFSSALGAYSVAADGTISNVQILFADASTTAVGSTAVVSDLAAGDTLEFFFIQDGAELASTMGINLSIDPSGDLLENGIAVDGITYYSHDTAYNEDGVEHFVSGAVDGGGAMRIGLEDMTGGGDMDYQDIVFTLTWDDI